MRVGRFFLPALMLAAISSATNAQTAELRAFKHGEQLVATENYRAAIEEYSKVPPQAGELYARATYNIGVCYYELWQTDVAIVFYERAVELKRGNYPQASYALGVALEDLDNNVAAQAAYEQATRASQRKFAPAIYRLGLFEAQAGRFQQAAALFREAASHKGAHVPASHNNLGVMLARLGMLKEAEQEFALALKTSDGRLADAVHNLTLCRSLAQGAAPAYKVSRID